MQRYFVEPYRFIPPYRSTFWVRMARGVILRHLRKTQGVVRFHVEGLDHLHRSREMGAGIVLSANHSRWADPMVLGAVCSSFKQYLYYVASYHLFRQNRVMGWVLNRLGGYSIWREGSDRESIKATATILADADRPVVLFPEGTWFRQNDRVNPLQDGISLIVRQAARTATRPVHVHPVGIKYWLLADPTSAVRKRLADIEKRLGWRSQVRLSDVERLEKVGSALLAVKEIEYLGRANSGDLDGRIQSLADSQVERLEKLHLGKAHDGWRLERIRRVRHHLSKKLLEPGTAADTLDGYRHDLDTLLFCENLNAHSMAYLRENPTPERLSETLLRLEETLTDAHETPLVEMGACVRFGEAIDAKAMPERRSGPDGFVASLRGRMQSEVDALNAQGPPAGWPGPPRPPQGTTAV